MAAGVYIWGAPGFLLGPVLAIIIIQALKVFEIDQKAGTYFSGVLDNLISDKDEKGKKAKHADSEEDSNDDSGEDAKESSNKGR